MNDSPGPLVCGIDSSTQATKVEIRRIDDGTVVATGRAPHPPTSPPRSEQDPDDWWLALRTALGKAAGTLGGSLQDVVALSVAGQQHGMVLVGADGATLRPAKLWNDTESAPQAAALAEHLGAASWAQRVGSVPVAAFTIAKLSWAAAREPEVLASTRRVMLPHDWLTHRLCGAYVTDRGDASGSGWWSPSGDAVDLELLALVDPDRDWASMVPEVLAHDATAGTLTARASVELGLPESCIVGPGTGDNMAAALGLGLGPGDVVMSLGTSGTVYAVSETPTADETGAVAGFADATGRFLPLVCTLNATKVTDAMAALLGLDHRAFAELALSGAPGAEGLTLVPYFDGERTPDLPTASGLLSGLRTSTDRASVARAAHEGVVCGLLGGVDALWGAGVDLSGRAFLVGGGARSVAYRRAVTDLWQRAVVVPDDDEVVATGACVQAASIATGENAGVFAERWRLGAGSETISDRSVDATAIRRRYAEAAALAI